MWPSSDRANLDFNQVSRNYETDKPVAGGGIKRSLAAGDNTSDYPSPSQAPKRLKKESHSYAEICQSSLESPCAPKLKTSGGLRRMEAKTQLLDQATTSSEPKTVIEILPPLPDRIPIYKRAKFNESPKLSKNDPYEIVITPDRPPKGFMKGRMKRVETCAPSEFNKTFGLARSANSHLSILNKTKNQVESGRLRPPVKNFAEMTMSSLEEKSEQKEINLRPQKEEDKSHIPTTSSPSTATESIFPRKSSANIAMDQSTPKTPERSHVVPKKSVFSPHPAAQRSTPRAHQSTSSLQSLKKLDRTTPMTFGPFGASSTFASSSKYQPVVMEESISPVKMPNRPLNRAVYSVSDISSTPTRQPIRVHQKTPEQEPKTMERKWSSANLRLTPARQKILDESPMSVGRDDPTRRTMSRLRSLSLSDVQGTSNVTPTRRRRTSSESTPKLRKSNSLTKGIDLEPRNTSSKVKKKSVSETNLLEKTRSMDNMNNGLTNEMTNCEPSSSSIIPLIRRSSTSSTAYFSCSSQSDGYLSPHEMLEIDGNQNNIPDKADKVVEKTTPKPLKRILKSLSESRLTPRKNVGFKEAKVFYFERRQGFGTVPQAGEIALDMNPKHFADKNFNLEKGWRPNLKWRSTSDGSEPEEDEILSESECYFDNESFTAKSIIRLENKERAKLLKKNGIRITYERAGLLSMEDIRESREDCGCNCRVSCEPATCSCYKNGIECQIDSQERGHPCVCLEERCRNTYGRHEFKIDENDKHRRKVLREIALMERTGISGHSTRTVFNDDGDAETSFSVVDCSPALKHSHERARLHREYLLAHIPPDTPPRPPRRVSFASQPSTRVLTLHNEHENEANELLHHVKPLPAPEKNSESNQLFPSIGSLM